MKATLNSLLYYEDFQIKRNFISITVTFSNNPFFREGLTSIFLFSFFKY